MGHVLYIVGIFEGVIRGLRKRCQYYCICVIIIIIIVKGACLLESHCCQ